MAGTVFALSVVISSLPLSAKTSFFVGNFESQRWRLVLSCCLL